MPALPSAADVRAAADARLGSPTIVASAVRAALIVRPGDARLHARLGRELAAHRRWRAAAEAYRAAVGLDDSRAVWHAQLGRALAKARRWDEAADAYGAAVGLDDSRAVWHVRRGRALAKARRWDEAADAYRAAVALDDDRAFWRFELGQVLAKARRWDEAADAYAAAVALDGDRPLWWFRLGGALQRSGRATEAADAYRAAVALDGDRASWRFQLGQVLAESRRWDEAVDAYHAALALDDRPARWHFQLGKTSQRAGRWQDAAAAYRDAIARDDTVSAWHEHLAAVLRRLGDTDGARAAATGIVGCAQDLTPTERRMLDVDPSKFGVRRTLLRFVTAHADEIRARAAELTPTPDAQPRVWLYWGQGIADAPPLVRLCHTELLRHHDPARVTVLDESDVDDHVELPADVRAHIGDDRTKFSDMLRVELLARYGGVWLDATCLARRDVLAQLPDLLSAGFFAPRYRPTRISSWFMASVAGGSTVGLLRAAKLTYWTHHEHAIDYFVLHHLFEALAHTEPEVAACCADMPHVRSQDLLRFARTMLAPYDAARFRALLDGAAVHKLTHKKLRTDRDLSNTMIGHLMRDGVPVAAEPALLP